MTLQLSMPRDLLRIAALAGALVVSGQALAHQYEGRFYSPHYHPYYVYHGYPEMWQPRETVNWDAVRTFDRPMLGNVRMDFCLKHSEYCGRAAANKFCHIQGFRYATQFQMSYHVGVTRDVATGKVNHHGHHHAFRYIRCRQ